jgi:hypothetical protein
MNDCLVPDGPAAPVPPLKSLKENGEPYRRRPNVETQLGRIWALPPSKRIPLIPRMYDECVFHLIRHGREGDAEVVDALVVETSKRIRRQVRSTARRLKKFIVEEIVMTVEMQILEPLLGDQPVDTLDFLEVGFAAGVRARTIDAMRVHLRSILGENRGWLETHETGVDGNPYERPFELVADTGASPEDAAAQLCLMEKAAASVDTPEQWRALELHYLEGMPVESWDPGKQDMMRELKATKGEIYHLLKFGIQAIRRRFLPPAESEGGIQ